MDDDEKGFGFGGRDPVPARPTANALAEAMANLLGAGIAWELAERDIPSETAQWSADDYTAETREAHNRAADAFEEAVVAAVTARGGLPAKRALLHAKLAGPWVPYNGSPHATATRTQRGVDCLVRFTPSEVYGVHRRFVEPGSGVEEPVALVGVRTEPQAPDESLYTSAEAMTYQEDSLDYGIVFTDWVINGWYWQVTPRWGKAGGYAATQEAACIAADEHLQGAAWLLSGGGGSC
jgi:hypothetical protein